MRFLITGGAGFIGSALIRYLINETSHTVLNLDKLTYAGNLDSLAEVINHDRYYFKQIDICNADEIHACFQAYQPDIVMHLAAESHVDRSIKSSAPFVQTNIVGTFILLEASRAYWGSLSDDRRVKFRFHHISTDEVYGDLADTRALFTENTAYDPSSPYSASKASSDHLVRAWYRTYQLPVLITNCSNNYGPYQFPEKLIPLMILNALSGKSLPVYGQGDQIRDWLFVEDHVRALYEVVTRGRIGETYNIGGHCEKKNIDVVHSICQLLEEMRPIVSSEMTVQHYQELITFVTDRPGHDKRYAIDASKIEKDLGWRPKENFDSGLRKTVEWYLTHPNWYQRILDKSYLLSSELVFQ